MTSKNVCIKKLCIYFLLYQKEIIPFSFLFQSYREYHADIFPLTNGLESGPGPSTWWNGSNAGVPKINLDPSKRPQSVLTVFGGALSERDANKVSSENGHTGTASSTSPATAQQQAKNGSNENNALPAASAQQQNSPVRRPIIHNWAKIFLNLRNILFWQFSKNGSNKNNTACMQLNSKFL